MTIIRSAAHFVLCTKCTLHGRIVCADGVTKGREIATKKGGEKEVERLLEAKKITPDEVPGLKRQMELAFDWIVPEDDFMDLESLEKTLQGLEELHGEFFEAALNQFHWSVLRIPESKENKTGNGKPTLH